MDLRILLDPVLKLVLRSSCMQLRRKLRNSCASYCESSVKSSNLLAKTCLNIVGLISASFCDLVFSVHSFLTISA